jgi:tetratricopeptide (TPR) repeat protein
MKLWPDDLGGQRVLKSGTLHWLDDAYVQAGLKRERIVFLERLRDWRLRTMKPDAPLVLDAWLSLAGAYRAAGRTQEARSAFDRVLEALRRSEKIGSSTATTRPSEAETLHDRGCLWARVGRFREAADDFAMAVELAPDNSYYWHDGLMPMLIGLGDVNGFHRKLKEELRQFKTSRDPATAHRVSKDALMVPLDGEDLKVAVELAERARNGSYGAYCQNKRMAEYRCGNYSETISWIRESMKIFEEPTRQVAAELFLAMSYERLGEQKNARETLGRAVARMEKEFPKPGEDDFEGFPDLILCQVLRREAEALINGGKEPTTKPSATAAVHE